MIRRPAKSADVATLIKHTNLAAKSAAELAEEARKRALDPALSANGVADARRAMDDAAFKRDRLQAAVTKLGERLEQPAFAQKLADVLTRIIANDHVLKVINSQLPEGVSRLPGTGTSTRAMC